MKRTSPKKSLVKREMLESDGVRKAIEAAGENIKLLSREELSQSLHRTIEQAPNKKSIWVFGYGSLIWNPMLNFTKKSFGYDLWISPRFLLVVTDQPGEPRSSWSGARTRSWRIVPRYGIQTSNKNIPRGTWDSLETRDAWARVLASMGQHPNR